MNGSALFVRLHLSRVWTAPVLARGKVRSALAPSVPAGAGSSYGADAPAPTTARTLPTRIVLLVLACALMAAAYWQFDRRQHNARSAQVESAAGAFLQQPPAAAAAGNAPAVPLSSYRCDGRQHCSQMTSCAEAKSFLKSCPDVKMDGDGDGVPCEQQLCTGPLGG